MNLVADENMEQEVVDRLRADGHELIYVAELSPSITDDEVLDEANARSALLLTGDKDFGELVDRVGRIHGGVVLTRLAGVSPASKAVIVSGLFREHSQALIGAFCVISPGGVRIRTQPRGT